LARCASLAWPTSLPDGPALFSLRPEHLRLGGAAAPGSGTVHVRGRVLHQAFHGATELIRVECADGLVLVARTSSGGVLHDQVDIEFTPADAVLVRESPERT